MKNSHLLLTVVVFMACLAVSQAYTTQVYELDNGWNCIEVPELLFGYSYDQNLGNYNYTANVLNELNYYL